MATSDDDACPICLNEFSHEGTSDRASLPCGHAFCTQCITQWSTRVHSCPLCKRAFDSLETSSGHVAAPPARGLGLEPADGAEWVELEVVEQRAVLSFQQRLRWRNDGMRRMLALVSRSDPALTRVSFPDDFEPGWLVTEYDPDEILASERHLLWHRREGQLLEDLLDALHEHRDHHHVDKLKIRMSASAERAEVPGDRATARDTGPGLGGGVLDRLCRVISSPSRLRACHLSDLRMDAAAWSRLGATIAKSSLRVVKFADIDLGREVGPASSSRIQGIFEGDQRAFDGFLSLLSALSEGRAERAAAQRAHKFRQYVLDIRFKDCRVCDAHRRHIAGLMAVHNSIRIQVQ